LEKNGRQSPLISIQILRAIAALGVVYTHCATEGGFSIKNTGAWGVDIFFILSGFIIAYIVSRDTSDFIKKRIFRVVPLYFIATFFVVLIAGLFPNLVHGTRLSTEKIIKSLLFIPYEDPVKENLPILGQGWTLRFEMFFYLTMAICLFFIKNKKYLAIACASILSIFVIIVNIVKSDIFILQYFGYGERGLLPEFIYGLLLFIGYNYLRSKTSLFELNGDKKAAAIIICSIVIVFCFICLVATDIKGIYFSKNRNINKGIPSLIIIIAFLVIENYINNENKWVKIMVLLGDASYAMYLFHYHVIAFLSRIIFPIIIGNTTVFVIEMINLLFTIFITIIVSIYMAPYNFQRNMIR
jgi:peptidoglycan/LPS O-acetylase OafA/YrhL